MKASTRKKTTKPFQNCPTCGIGNLIHFLIKNPNMVPRMFDFSVLDTFRIRVGIDTLDTKIFPVTDEPWDKSGNSVIVNKFTVGPQGDTDDSAFRLIETI